MTRMGQLALTLAALAFAAAAGLSGLDRASAQFPGLARLVPDGVKAQAWQVSANRQLALGDAGGATQSALAAIDRDPMAQPAARSLAAARMASGEREAAGRAFAASDLLGHRDTLMQAYFFDIAIAADDAGRAAERLDRLLRVRPRLAANGYFFAALEESVGGRQILAQRLVAQPIWAETYLTAYRADDETLRRRSLYLADNAASLPLGCERTAPMLEELSRRAMRSEALRLAEAQCPHKARGQLVADADFESLGQESMLGWRRHGSGDVRISTAGNTDKVVEVDNRSPSTRLVLSQPVALTQGEYRLFASVAAGRRDRLLASLDCGTPRRPSARGGSLGQGQLVAAPDCRDLVLGIWVRPGNDPVRFDDLRIEPVGEGAP